MLTDIHATNEFLLRFIENLLLGQNHILKNRHIHIHYTNLGKKSSEKKEKSSEKIVQLIKNSAKITIRELAQRLNILTRAVERNISKLKIGGTIERIGSDKAGYWEIVKK